MGNRGVEMVWLVTDKKHRVSVEQALAIINERIQPLGNEAVAVSSLAYGRKLAKPAIARDDSPRFDCAAMDGFAFRTEDIASATSAMPRQLGIAQPIPAGNTPVPVSPGVCAPISTGAKIPPNADAVIEKEAVSCTAEHVTFSKPVEIGRNIRRQGEDVEMGVQILERDTILEAAAIGALLNGGVREVEVRRRPRITLLSTGSEIAPATESLAQAMRFDANGPMIEAACRGLGLPCEFHGLVQDDRKALDRAFRELELGESDMVVTTGGVSVGSYDFVREMLEERGARIWIHGIAMRPGKPLLFATLPNGRPWFGLPGNSIAAFVGFRFFVLAAVRRMMGLPAEEGLPVTVDVLPRIGLTLFLRGRRAGTDEAIDIGLDQRSHIFRSLLLADCWVCADQLPNGEISTRLFEKMPNRMD
jgi:molybdopterin molybdotransferase